MRILYILYIIIIIIIIISFLASFSHQCYTGGLSLKSKRRQVSSGL